MPLESLDNSVAAVHMKYIIHVKMLNTILQQVGYLYISIDDASSVLTPTCIQLP